MDAYFDYFPRFIWLTIALAAALLLLYAQWMRRRALRAFADYSLDTFLAPQRSRWRFAVRMGLRILALVLLVVALTGPRWGMQAIDAQKKRLDLIVCLDVSRSMLANDAGMPRIDRAKDDIDQLLDDLGGTNIGLITFAGKSEMVCPLTDDYEFFRLILDEVGTHSAPLGGTNIGHAIYNARLAFGPRLTTARAIVIMTDGEDHLGEAVEEARQAADADIVVYCIGLGDDDRGALVPTSARNRRDYLMYNEQQVWSKLDPQKLTAIARAGGGEYYKSGLVSNGQRTLEWLFEQRLRPQMTTNDEDKKIDQRKPQFFWFAIGALALLSLEFLIPMRRRIDPLPQAVDQLVAGEIN